MNETWPSKAVDVALLKVMIDLDELRGLQLDSSTHPTWFHCHFLAFVFGFAYFAFFTASSSCLSEQNPTGSRFSRRVPVKRKGSWGMMISCSLNSSRSSILMLTVSMYTSPADTSVKRKRQWNKEDLPLPVLPTIPTSEWTMWRGFQKNGQKSTFSPAFVWRLTELSAQGRWSWYLLMKLLIKNDNHVFRSKP